MSNFDFDNDNNINVAELIAQFEQSVKNDHTPFFDQDDFEAIVEYYEEKGQFEQLKAIYKKSVFFRTLMDNSEMSLIKTFMPLTSEISEHPIFGDIWQRINAEYELTSTNLLLLGNHTTLMEEYPVDKLSIQMREKIMQMLRYVQR